MSSKLLDGVSEFPTFSSLLLFFSEFRNSFGRAVSGRTMRRANVDRNDHHVSADGAGELHLGDDSKNSLGLCSINV